MIYALSNFPNIERIFANFLKMMYYIQLNQYFHKN